jgi:hypothetical protein
MSMRYVGNQNREAQDLRAQVNAVESAERDARHSLRLAKLQKRLIVSRDKQSQAEERSAQTMQEVVEMRQRRQPND